MLVRIVALEDVLGKLHRRAEDLRPMMEEIQLKATGVAKSGGQRGPGTVKSDEAHRVRAVQSHGREAEDTAVRSSELQQELL